MGRNVSMVCAAFHGHSPRSRSMISNKRPNRSIFSSLVCMLLLQEALSS